MIAGCQTDETRLSIGEISQQSAETNISIWYTPILLVGIVINSF